MKKVCEYCGTEFEVTGQWKRKGCTNVCSRKIQEKTMGKVPSTTHGYAKVGQVEKLHNLWRGILKRCYTKTATNYHLYGGRGIKMCESWRTDYMSFRTWAHENGYMPNLQIERINNDGDYEPSNCKWATRQEQCQNRRTSKFFTVDGVTATTRYFADKKGIKFSTAYYQLTRGIY